MRRKLKPMRSALLLAFPLSSANHLYAQSNVPLGDQMDYITAP